jgi:hypothetical protein
MKFEYNFHLSEVHSDQYIQLVGNLKLVQYAVHAIDKLTQMSLRYTKPVATYLRYL